MADGKSSTTEKAPDISSTLPQQVESHSRPTSSHRFAPEEEAELLQEAQTLKTSANALFSRAAYSDAISTYDRALASCPNYLEYEIAVLNSNIAACHLKLEQWKEAIESATKALDGLERELPTKPKQVKKDGDSSAGAGQEDGKIVEIEGDDEDVAEQLEKLQLSDERKAQIESLRAKSLLRRGKASVGLGGWSQLAAAETDFKALATMSILPPGDMKFVRQQLVALPAKVKEAQEKEVGEMMGKLKDLGNGLLKPFGLSTDMFQFNKDESTGGYNMSFGNKD